MNRTFATILIAAAIGATRSQADFNPVALTPGSFTADVIVEKTAPKSINDFTTATMDNVGTNNTANVWYETGYFTNSPWTGVPAQGSTFVAFSDVNRQFKMPPNYAANNALFIANHPGAGLTAGTLTLSAPAAFSRLSIMGSAGNGPVNLNYTVHHSGGADETGTIAINDWFGGSTYAWCANGRMNVNDGTVNSLSYTNGNGVRINYGDIALGDTVNPVTSIDLTYVSGGRTAIFGVSGSTDNTIFTPVTVTGFNRDMIVEATAPKSGYNRGANVTMENPSSGAANAGNGWYEQGFNRGALTTGVPTNGTSFTTGTRTYQMAPDYTTNCVFFISENPGTTTSTITLSSPASYTGLSFLSSAGNGTVSINVIVHHASDADENFSIGVLDWFNAATATFTANGRYVKETRTFNNVNGGVKIFNNDITLVGTSPVTSIDLTYAGASGGGRAMIFAVSGTTGGNYTPVTVSGYNADGIVERTVPVLPLPLTSATTVSMDGGTNNTANTWYEKGYYGAFTNTGFPPAGSTIDSLAQPDHHYQMPPNYAANNAVFIDAVTTNANLRIASPTTYSALSFLSATANGTVTNQAIMQYADGTSETNTFNSVDWFGNTPYAFVANGRVNLDRRTIDSDPGRNATPYNPRLYEAQFALGNVGSPVTNIVLRYLNPTNSTGRLVVFAVSATAGAVPPIIASVSVSPNATFDGSNIVFNAVITGGTAPITYQWQKGTNGVYVNVSNGGTIAGATTTNMTITGAAPSDAADYRLVASNVTGSVNSGIATLIKVVSPKSDVTSPLDVITLSGGTAPVNEAVTHAIDNVTDKYLNFDALDNVNPFVGPVGFVVKPAIGNTIVTTLRFYTANDAEGRDPADYVLEGSQDGYTFAPIASGSLALPSGRNAAAAAVNPLTQNVGEARFANSAGYSYYRLTFNNVKDNANNNSMQIGEIEFLGIVNPNPPPTFTVSPTDVSANEGAAATFTSLATGAAPITYQWYDVTAGDPGTSIPSATSPNLTLNSVTTGMSGNLYRVVATNPSGSVTNPSPALPGAQLTVSSGAPTVVQDLPAEVLFYAGRTLSLSVGVAGTAPSYQWQSNGVNMVNNGRVSGATSSVLTITNAQLGDAATYQLLSSNSFAGPVPSTAASVYVTVAPDFHTNGVGWAFTNQGGGGSFFSGPDVLSLTSANDQRRAAWFTTPMNISAFQASFLYQDVSIGGADGLAFVIQNSPQGTNAIGGGGGAMAYDGITPSAAVKLNIFGSSSVAFTTGGAAGTFTPTSPVDLAGGDPIQVNLNYDGSTFSIKLSNTVSAVTFSTNISAVNLASVVGTNVAYVGITAATGGSSANQQVSNFRYVPIPRVSNSSVGANVLLTWPGTIGGYRVDVTPSLSPTSWSTLPGLIDQTNATMYKVVAPSGNNNFYRLSLPLP